MLHYDIKKDCAFIAWRTYQNWYQRKTKNQYTHRSDLKIGKRHRWHKGAATLAVIIPSCGDPLFSCDESTAVKIKSTEAKISESCNAMHSISSTPVNAYRIISVTTWHSPWFYEVKTTQQFWKGFLLLQLLTNWNTYTKTTKMNQSLG